MNKQKLTFKERIANFFTQTLRHNWVHMLLSLFAGILIVLLVNFI